MYRIDFKIMKDIVKANEHGDFTQVEIDEKGMTTKTKIIYPSPCYMTTFVPRKVFNFFENRNMTYSVDFYSLSKILSVIDDFEIMFDFDNNRAVFYASNITYTTKLLKYTLEKIEKMLQENYTEILSIKGAEYKRVFGKLRGQDITFIMKGEKIIIETNKDNVNLGNETVFESCTKCILNTQFATDAKLLRFFAKLVKKNDLVDLSITKSGVLCVKIIKTSKNYKHYYINFFLKTVKIGELNAN